MSRIARQPVNSLLLLLSHFDGDHEVLIDHVVFDSRSRLLKGGIISVFFSFVD